MRSLISAAPRSLLTLLFAILILPLASACTLSATQGRLGGSTLAITPQGAQVWATTQLARDCQVQTSARTAANATTRTEAVVWCHGVRVPIRTR